MRNVLPNFSKYVYLNSVLKHCYLQKEPRQTQTRNETNKNMKRKIITLGALTLAALIPLAILSVDDAAANRTASPGVTPVALSSSVTAKISPKAKSEASVPSKTAEKKTFIAAKPSSRTTSKSKTSSTGDRSSNRSSKEKEDSKAKPSHASREQREAKEQVADLTTTQKSKMLILLNEGDTERLAMIKGISTTRASAIEKARPFSSIDEVVLVRGIGESTFGEVIAHARSLTARRTGSSSSSSKSKTSKS